jgi:hypothetical protein
MELENGRVISRQQRDVNRPPDPVLELTAVAFFAGLYSIGGDNQARRFTEKRLPSASQCRLALYQPALHLRDEP